MIKKTWQTFVRIAKIMAKDMASNHGLKDI